MSLTIVYITSRKEPKIEWFLDSLHRILPSDCDMQVIIVDGRKHGYGVGYSEERFVTGPRPLAVQHVEPKPTIWSGRYRITNTDWWSKSNSLNTAICLCETSYIAFVDDRCVLSPAWIHCVEESIAGQYAVCGSYEKRANMVVKDGEIIDMGTLLGADTRTQAGYPYATQDWYGGSGALPLDWCLAVNGFAEKLCDGASAEDSVFGICLRNSGFPIMYDPRMLIIEDRTPGQIDGGLKRADKGPPGTSEDKSHKIIEIIRDKTTSQNDFDIRELRDRVLSGEPFPPPCASHYDWYDNQSIAEM